MSGYVVAWWCLCTDAAAEEAELPSTCPEHGSPRTGPPIRNPRAGGVTPGHQCPRPHPRATDHDREDDDA